MTSPAKVKVTKSLVKVIIGKGTNTQIPKAGLEDIGLGDTQGVVVFATARPDTNYTVVATIQNTDDTNPQILPCIISAKAKTGFTVKWDVPTDSVNYKNGWLVVDHNNQ